MSQRPHPSITGANARRLIVAGCAGLAVLVLAQGCASVSIEEAVPSGALAASSATSGATDAAPVLDAFPPRPGSEASPLVAEPAPVISAAPVTSAAVVEAMALAEADGVAPAAPRDTSSFPNFNLPPRSATQQFTPSETSAKTRELRGAASQVKSAGADISADKKELDRLRKLGQSHGKDALKAIEKR